MSNYLDLPGLTYYDDSIKKYINDKVPTIESISSDEIDNLFKYIVEYNNKEIQVQAMTYMNSQGMIAFGGLYIKKSDIDPIFYNIPTGYNFYMNEQENIFGPFDHFGITLSKNVESPFHINYDENNSGYVTCDIPFISLIITDTNIANAEYASTLPIINFVNEFSDDNFAWEKYGINTHYILYNEVITCTLNGRIELDL